MPQRSGARTKICLIGIDGLRLPIALPVAPTLAHLAATGQCADMTMEVPTYSGPGWATLLTGSTHAQHGISDNSFIGSRLWHRPDLLSRAFYADQSTTTFAAGAWPPILDPASAGPIIHPRVEQQLAGQHRLIVRDGETYGYPRMDAEIAYAAAAALTYGPDVNFIYFCNADESAHVFGSLSTEYTDAIAGIDAHLARLLSIIEGRAAQGEDWLVVVTTDHGHRDEGGHGGDSAQERASFAIAKRFGPSPDFTWPSRLEPHELVDTLLSFRRDPAGD